MIAKLPSHIRRILLYAMFCVRYYMRQILFYIMYYVSCVTPRNRNIWIFGSWQGGKFADNSKYLFLYVKREHPEIRPLKLLIEAHTIGIKNVGGDAGR